MINLVGYICRFIKVCTSSAEKAENYCLAAILQQIHYLLYMIVFDF